MIKVSFDPNRLKQLITKRVAEKVAFAGSRIYNNIVGGVRGQDWPYWSGSYIASWNYNYGTIDTSFKAPPKFEGSKPSVTYQRPRSQSILPNYSSPFQKLFISNSVPHAGIVEEVGTPKHPDPWKIAFNAVNNYKIRMNP